MDFNKYTNNPYLNQMGASASGYNISTTGTGLPLIEVGTAASGINFTSIERMFQYPEPFDIEHDFDLDLYRQSIKICDLFTEGKM